MKGPKGWDYLNEYKQTADGQYVYTGNLYVLHDAGNVRRKIGVLWALTVLAVIGSGLINAGGMNNSFYVIIPYIIEVICAFAMSWHVIRLIFTKGDFKEYYYNKIVNGVPASSFILCISAAAGFIASVVFDILHSFDGKMLLCILYLISKLVCISFGVLIYRFYKTVEWEKRETHN